MTARACVTIALAAVAIASTAHAQTNSWISPTRGYWDDYTKWSLGVAPSTNGQLLVLITNAPTKDVTIDAVTASNFPDSMTVSNLTLSAPAGATNTLELSGAGTNRPLVILDTVVISPGGLLELSGSSLWAQGVVTNANTNAVPPIVNRGFGVDGAIELDANGVLAADCGIYVGNDTNADGVVWLNGGQLLLTNQASGIGIGGAGQLIVSSGTVQSPGFTLVGVGAGSQGTLTVAGGTYASSLLGRLAVGMETGATGVVTVNSGSLVMTNALLTLVGGNGSGQLNLLGGTNTLGPVEVGGDDGSQGTLTMAGGVTTVQGLMAIGSSSGATGAVWVTDGQLVQTNTYLGPSMTTNFTATSVGQFGGASLTVSNGAWLGGAMMVGEQSNSVGTVNLNGGTMTLYSKLILGNCPTGGIGVVNVAGGTLYVTNAAHNAVIDLRQGQLNLSGGVLQVDILVMTNGCGSFVRGGGTLVIGSLVDGIPSAWKTQYGFDPLDPTVAGADPDGDGMSNLQEYIAGTDPTNNASSFRITSIVAQGNDLLVSWTAATNKTYTVLVATNGISSSLANAFTPLGTVVVPATPAITLTNYLDAGSATNSPARFYRVKVTGP